ncbi:MAG: VWA domain-containing protein [Phycisphaerales bacterium JB047]
MTFLAPIAGLIAGVVGSGLVLLMYMLKLRRRPVLVSSTLLWSRAVRDLEGNIPWQRLSPTMLLVLHLLIVALLALAIARPVADTALGDGQRVALIIDTSASMNAIDGDRSLLEIAKRDASERVRGLFDSGRSPLVSVIEAGIEPRILVGDSSERGRVLSAIEGIGASDQAGDVRAAIQLIDRLQGQGVGEQGEEDTGGTTLVWVFSDGGSIGSRALPMRSGSGMQVPSYVGGGLSNMGIVSLSAQRDRVDTELCRVFVRVLRSESGPIAGVVRVFEGDEVIASAPVAFDAGQQSATHTFALRLVRDAMLRVELAADDALGTDNVAWVAVPSPEPVRVTIVAPEAIADPLLIDYLEVVARAPVRVIAPYEVIDEPDLIVYDRVDARALPGVASLGFDSVTPGLGERLDERTETRRVLSWDRQEPMLRDTGLGAVSYQRRISFERLGTGVRPLASDQDGAIMVEATHAGVRHVRVGFALHDSDWSVQVGLPVFLAQLCEQLLPGAGGNGEVVRSNEVVRYLDEDGVERSVGPFAEIGERVLPDGRRIGVSLLSEQESMLATRAGVVIGAGDTDQSMRASGRARVDLWRWFVGSAIVLLLLEWAWYLHKVRIAL